jgi:uncharacterized protein (DUF58 family)
LLKATKLGNFVIAAIVAIAFSLVVFPDVLTSTAFLVLFALVAFEAGWVLVVTRRPGRWFSLNVEGKAPQVSKISRVLYPGDAGQDGLSFTKRVSGTATMHPALSFLKLSPTAFRGRGKTTKLTAEFLTPFSGEYHSEKVDLDVNGPLKLLSGSCTLPASFDYSVYPHTLAVAIESARILGKGAIGDFPVDKPGIGTEFYDIREYQTGDDFRQVNWKSTAKRGDLMVNEHMREVSASYYLVLEAVSPSYFDKDRLAATFLGLANTLATLRIRFGVVVHDDEKVMGMAKIDDPLVSLEVALQEAIGFVGLNETASVEELSSLARGAAVRATRALDGRGQLAVSELIDLGQSQRKMFDKRQGVVQTITRLVKESAEEPPAVVYVSGLFNRLETLLDIAWDVDGIYRAEFVAIDPVAPWISARDEDEAYELYLNHQKKLGALRSAGIKYHIGEPSSVVQRVFSF